MSARIIETLLWFFFFMCRRLPMHRFDLRVSCFNFYFSPKIILVSFWWLLIFCLIFSGMLVVNVFFWGFLIALNAKRKNPLSTRVCRYLDTSWINVRSAIYLDIFNQLDWNISRYICYSHNLYSNLQTLLKIFHYYSCIFKGVSKHR